MESCPTGRAVWPVATEITSGSGPASSATSPRVEALMVSAVSDVRHSTASTTRPVATWMRCASEPRTRAASRRQPPMRRSSSTRAETHNTPMGQRNARRTPTPGVAQEQRAVQVLHPARQRRRLPSAQHATIGRVHVGRLRLVADKANTTMAPEGRWRISSAPGTVRVTRSTSVATDRSSGAAGACHACCTGSNAKMAPVMPSHHGQGAYRQAQPAVD